MTEGVARVIVGRYRLVRLLGRGGMGAVWQAHDTLLGRDVAIKEIWFPSAGNEPVDPADPLVRRALREAQAAARLHHPGIVTVHDVVTDQGRPWIVMELINGRSLAEVIREQGLLTEQRTAEVGLHVLDALRTAHREGISHRDVKPANILLDDADRVVLTDFGIAAIDDATALTATGQMVGSPAYLAPERINGRPATAAADLWALGVTLYTAVTGSSPFQRDDTQATIAAVLTSRPATPAHAGRLWPVIKGLLVKDPATRLTAEKALQLLANVAYPTGSPEAAGRTAERRRPRWWPDRSGRQRPTLDGLPGTLAAPPPTIAAPTAYQDTPRREATPARSAAAGSDTETAENGLTTVAPDHADPGPTVDAENVPTETAAEPPTAETVAAEPSAAETLAAETPAASTPAAETAAAETVPAVTVNRLTRGARLIAGTPPGSGGRVSQKPPRSSPRPDRPEPALTSRPRRSVVLFAVLAATAATAIAGAGTLYALNRPDSPGSRSAADPAAHTAVTSAPSAANTLSPVPDGLADRPPQLSSSPPVKRSRVPAPFHGRWVGIADQPMSKAKSWPAVITFSSRSDTGKFEAVSLGCTGVLTVTAPAPTERVLHVRQRTTRNSAARCAEGAKLTLIINSAGGIDMFWQDAAASNNTATATLVAETLR